MTTTIHAAMTAIQNAMEIVKQLDPTDKKAMGKLLEVYLKAEGISIDPMPSIPTAPAGTQAPANDFKFGEVLTFMKSGSGRHAGRHYIRLEKFNRAGTAGVGYECDKDGVPTSLQIRWTVALTHLSRV